MSRIGYRKLTLPDGVTLKRDGNNVTVAGKKGTLTRAFSPKIAMIVKGKKIAFKPKGKYDYKTRALHGTMNANLKNMINGVTKGYTKTLKLVGVGYRAKLQGKTLVLNVGYSNPVKIAVDPNLTVKVPKKDTIIVSGINKQLVGDFAAGVRSVRSPEPYKGKGIRYEHEHILRKEGKTGK
ncbi:MAG: 50S ribosomal protein L6 [Acetilactobacillus jinshanensis]